MNNAVPFMSLIIGTIIYGLMNAIFRFVGDVNYFSAVFVILLLSTILILPVLSYKRKLRDTFSFKKVPFILSLGLFQSATWLLIFIAIMNTSIANAVLGYMITPVFVITLSPLMLRENTGKKIMLPLFLAVIGIVLIFDPRNLLESIPPVGIISGILAGFSYAMVQMLARKLKDQYDAFSLNFLATFFGMILLLPLFLLNASTLPNMTSLSIIILLSLGGTVGGIMVYYALKHILAQNVSIILLMEPLVSIVAALILFLEVPSLLTIFGGFLLLVADIIVIRSQS
jgi:drug/metabolite transporter (DMT)-like permease